MVADPGGVDPDLDHKFNLKLNPKHLDPLRNPQVEIDRIQKQSPYLDSEKYKEIFGPDSFVESEPGFEL